jgi:hypothetical protein
MNIETQLTTREEQLGSKSLDPNVYTIHTRDKALLEFEKRMKAGLITVEEFKKIQAELIDEKSTAEATAEHLSKLGEEIQQDPRMETSGVTVFHRMTKPQIVALANRTEKIPLLNLPPYQVKELDAFEDDTMIPGIYDYQIRGFFKAAAGALKVMDEINSESRKLTNYKSNIDRLIFVRPRFIPFILPAGAKMGVCERPLRAETAMGPRVALARSETAPAGTTLRFEILALSRYLGKGEETGGKGTVNVLKMITEWLEYGAYSGLGQWRNSSKGIFDFKFLGEVGYTSKQAEVK